MDVEKDILELTALDTTFEESANFIPYRIFINHVDTLHGRAISSIIADKYFSAPIQEIAGEGGEEALGEAEETGDAPNKLPPVKFQVVGTVKSGFYKQTEDVHMLIAEDDNFAEEVLRCGFIIFDITLYNKEIKKARNILKAIERTLDQRKEDAPKAFEASPDRRVFILISTALTWARSKPVDPDDPDVPFVETDFKKRRPHANYKEHIDLEKEAVEKGKKHKGKFTVYVLCSGIIYGLGEESLHFLFKKAWFNEPDLPIIQPGKNTIPLIHVNDLGGIIAALLENGPKNTKYMLAVEQTLSTQRKVVKSIATAIGSGRTKMVTKAEAFLIPDLTQKYYDIMTVNLKMEPGYIINELGYTFKSDLNFCENINKIAQEFKDARKLHPIRILLHGPPAVGKTSIAKQLCEYYDIHYISVKSLIEDAIAELQSSIEFAREQMKAKEKKAEEEKEEEEEEEEEDEEDDLETQIAELTGKLKEIRKAVEDNENGRLPDETVIELLKQKLESNPCQNQGYVLDGYPKTDEQAKLLFGFGGEDEGEEEEEEAEEEGDEEGERKKVIIPEFVISLEADDEFLCCRVMRMPERDVQGTHYVEERMVQRLSEYRKNNTEDNTLLNLFDVKEIHPLIIHAETDIQETLLNIIYEKIGEKRGYPPSEEELEAMRKAEKAAQLKRDKIELQKKQELEQLYTLERYRNMETWMDVSHALQEQEELYLAAQNKPLREYLMKFVFPVLTRGLLEIARIKPDDPIDYLAEYLFRENPEGRMFDPSYVKEADDLLDYVREFQHKVSKFLKLKSEHRI